VVAGITLAAEEPTGRGVWGGVRKPWPTCGGREQSGDLSEAP
jgi:hypothetical protein